MRLMRVLPSGASSTTMSRHFGRTMPSTGTSAVEKYCRPSPSAARIRASASMIGLWAPFVRAEVERAQELRHHAAVVGAVGSPHRSVDPARRCGAEAERFLDQGRKDALVDDGKDHLALAAHG